MHIRQWVVAELGHRLLGEIAELVLGKVLQRCPPPGCRVQAQTRRDAPGRGAACGGKVTRGPKSTMTWGVLTVPLRGRDPGAG